MQTRSETGLSPFWQRILDRQDWNAAWTSALIMMPQAVILSTLAGLPPEAGVYASVFPVAVAALVGSCPKLLSGPNTAVAVMIASTLTPLATPFSADYMLLALMLSVMVGAIQLFAAASRVGHLFELLPDFIIQGVTLGVGLVIICTQSAALLGVLGVNGEPPWMSLWRLPAALDHANPYAIAVSAVGLVCGFAAGRSRLGKKVSPLIIGLAASTLVAIGLDKAFGAANVDVERVGYISLSALPFSMPPFHWEELYQLKQIFRNALAIAFVGVLQTLIIVRNSQAVGDQPGSPNREMLAQGIANIVAGFTSGFAGSGSFNRSAAHAAAGARTRLAAVLSAVFMLALGFGAAPFIAQIPMPALGATLVLIGVDLIRSVNRQTKFLAAPGRSRNVLIVAVLIVFTGLESALFCALFLTSMVFLWRYPSRKARLENSADVIRLREQNMAPATAPAERIEPARNLHGKKMAANQ